MFLERWHNVCWGMEKWCHAWKRNFALLHRRFLCRVAAKECQSWRWSSPAEKWCCFIWHLEKWKVRCIDIFELLFWGIGLRVMSVTTHCKAPMPQCAWFYYRVHVITTGRQWRYVENDGRGEVGICFPRLTTDYMCACCAPSASITLSGGWGETAMA